LPKCFRTTGPCIPCATDSPVAPTVAHRTWARCALSLPQGATQTHPTQPGEMTAMEITTGDRWLSRREAHHARRRPTHQLENRLPQSTTRRRTTWQRENFGNWSGSHRKSGMNTGPGELVTAQAAADRLDFRDHRDLRGCDRTGSARSGFGHGFVAQPGTLPRPPDPSHSCSSGVHTTAQKVKTVVNEQQRRLHTDGKRL
jgi:hypothetical protein